MGLYKPKRTMEAPDVGYGVCVWRFDDGSYLMDEYQNHFCAQGVPFDIEVEKKMIREATLMGISTGKPFWLPGFRKISTNEWEDQMALLLEGEIPDAVDVYRQSENGV